MCDVIVLCEGYSRQLDDGRMDANCTSTLIKGAKNIVVDTMTAWDGDRLRTETYVQTLLPALLENGVKPSEVDYVVCTHSHADHIGNNNLFLNAEHIIGCSVQRGSIFYEKQLKREDYKLCEGVRVTASPGHTYEDVTVLVETGKGTDSVVVYAITGDLFEKKEDIADSSLWKNLGTPELVKIQAMMRLRMVRCADYIIPGHGPMFRTNSSLVDSLEDQLLKMS